MKIKKLTDNLIKIDNKHYATISKSPGINVYGEKTIRWKDKELRIWNPSKSKLSAALHNNLPLEYIREIENATTMLYLGIANGTTASHIEDLNPNMTIFGVEISPRSIIDLIYMIENRKSNIIPILESASHPHKYSFMLTKVDTMYVDIAQPHQTDIALKNAEIFLKRNKYLFLTIKTRSIDIKKKPKEVIRGEIKKIENNGYEVTFKGTLHPYEKDHGFVIVRK